jgi:hypothetical protein
MEDCLDEYERNLRAIVEEARKRSIRMIFVTQPTFYKDSMAPEEEKLLWMGLGPGPSGKPLKWPVWKNDDAIVFTPRAMKAAMDSYNQRLLLTCAQLQVECFDAASRLPDDGRLHRRHALRSTEPGCWPRSWPPT